MTAQLIDGKAFATKLRTELAEAISLRKQQGLSLPGLAVILVGDDPASLIYVHNKQQACKEVGIQSSYFHLPSSISEQELINLITDLNEDQNVHGILIQLPLPAHIDAYKILEYIHPQKDVDGFHPYNLGRLAQRRPLLRSCTPYGVMQLLTSLQINFKNQHAVIIGASNIVGRPMALELLLAGCTISVCHRFTQDLAPYVQSADLLISAVGKPGIIRGEWIKPQAIVIDIGITRLADGSLAGDIEFDSAKERAAWITPVPGGVGPMTVVTLLKNTLTAAEHQDHQKM